VIQGPVDTTRTPRFAGPPTYALLPRRDQVSHCDVAVLGVPFDSGTSYRPGARFGPAAVRQGSRLLRPYHPGLAVAPFGVQQVADAGDIACNPFNIAEAVAQVEAGATALLIPGQTSVRREVLRSEIVRHLNEAVPPARPRIRPGTDGPLPQGGQL